jgi:hypothetical protein
MGCYKENMTVEEHSLLISRNSGRLAALAAKRQYDSLISEYNYTPGEAEREVVVQYLGGDPKDQYASAYAEEFEKEFYR